MLPRRGGRPSKIKLLLDYLRTPRFDPLRMTTSNRSVMAFNLSFLTQRAELLRAGLVHVTDLYESGALPAPEVRSFPLDGVAEAHACLESGSTVGKLVLTV